jgi:hypothetical protein
VFENRMLRGILGPKREEVAGGRRRLHNEELHNLFVSPNIIRVIISKRIKWAVNVAHTREVRNRGILIGKPEGKRPLGRPKRRWEDNIRLDLREIESKGVDSSGSGQRTVASSCE